MIKTDFDTELTKLLDLIESLFTAPTAAGLVWLLPVGNVGEA